MVGVRTERLIEFTQWCAKHVVGDEKGEAQLFLDRLFRAFDQKGVKEAGATLEMRVKKADAKGTAFADLVWKPIVLIEMKRRGEDLCRHYRQAFDYWTRLVPGRPRYVVLCNFDEFWVYDFETQMDTPVDKLKLVDLPNRYGPLAFLFPTQERPTFGNDQEAVTRDAADKLATCFNKLVRRQDVDRATAQRFVLQMLVALFAEDIGLLDKYFVTQLLEDCKSPRDTYDLLGGLFEAMNTPGRTQGGRFIGIDYFNGGLFAQPVRLELDDDELNQLKRAASADWSKVRPEIFGTIFEHSMEASERHAFGAHFTTPADIMKIVGPTIVAPWRELIENADTVTRLNGLLDRMRQYRVLDPACGSGNFLYVAYRELKRLEARAYERLASLSKRRVAKQRAFGFVTTHQFFGLDINPFAVELAKVTMMIARKLAIDELHVTERALPLDNLDSNFVAADALIDAKGDAATWPQAEVIIGNPPFLGAKRLKPERGPDYVNAVRRAYPDVPGMADYCVYWFRKAHDHLPPCTASDPLVGRAGLVGTQNIRNNQSRVGGLDYIVQSGTILEAVENQPWSGEANVHVSICNWVKTQDRILLPKKRRLWFEIPSRLGNGRPRKRESGSASKAYELSYRDCSHLNSALSDDTDVSAKRTLNCNKKPKRCFQGKIPGYEGFMLDAATASRLRKDSAEVIVPYLTGRELLGDFRIERWAIDFRDMDMVQASRFHSAFEHCRKHVLPAVQRTYDDANSDRDGMEKARGEHLQRWWQFWNRRDELNEAISRIKRYIGCSRVTRRPVMVFLSSAICPSDLVQVFAFDDDYSFGVLQSSAHFEWFRKSSRLKIETDLRYSVREVFETFPWPQHPTEQQVRAVVQAAVELRRVREVTLRDHQGGLRAVYRLLESPGRHPLKDAHERLDAAVLAAYGFDPDAPLLDQLLQLNLSVSQTEESGRQGTGPGIPDTFADRYKLVSADGYKG